MNYAPLLIMPYTSIWSGLKALQYHPDAVNYLNVTCIEDLRENYLPKESYGNTYIPFIKPVIATMPGLREKSEQANIFFERREYYLINSHRFTWGIVNLTACAAAAVFLTTLMPAIAFTAGAGVIFTYMVVAKLINGYYETKADEYVLNEASPSELSAGLGFIIALQEKAKTNPQVRTFKELREKLESRGAQPTAMPADIFAAHDERKSSMGLPYTMRPSMDDLNSFALDEVKEAFLERETFHFNLENSDLVKIAGAVGFVTVTALVAPAQFFFSPLLYVAGFVFMYGFYSVTHLVGDYYFKRNYDPQNEIGQHLSDYPELRKKIYTGAY